MSAQPIDDPQASNGAPRIGHAIDTGELAPDVHRAAELVMIELIELRQMKRRANEVRQRPTPWHPKDGPKHAWQQAIAEQILGE